VIHSQESSQKSLNVQPEQDWMLEEEEEEEEQEEGLLK
jgi:hypothetical protein